MTRRAVGIFVALSAEARALSGRIPPVRTPILIENDVLLWLGGVGGDAATRGCRALVEAGAGALASVGTAAGLAPDCAPGTVVLPHQVIMPGREPVTVDAAWRRALGVVLEMELSVAAGDVTGTDSVLGRREKQILYRQTGAVSADMETSAVAMASAGLDVPLMVVRVVSDGPMDAVPAGVLGAVDAYGRPRYRQLLFSLARRPAETATLLRLASGFRIACRTLRQVVRCAGLRFRCPD